MPSLLARLLVRPTAAERAARLPGDERVDPADAITLVVMDRAFTLDATPERVWPWLVQLGKQRAGWYFPRWVELAIVPSRRGLRRIDPVLQSLRVGDVIPDWGGADATFTVAELVPADHLLHTSKRGRTELTWCLRLSAAGSGGTRVHLRLRLAPVRHHRLASAGGGLIDLLTIAGLAAGLRERA